MGYCIQKSNFFLSYQINNVYIMYGSDRLIMLRVAIDKQKVYKHQTKQKFIKQSNNLSNYQLHYSFYKIIHSNKHGIVHMNYQTIMIIVLHSVTPYQGSCPATTACSPPLIRRRSMEISCRSRLPPPKASAQVDVSMSGSSSSVASSSLHLL